ncbi:MAG: DUF6502 family protein [Candidatus Binatia bacterium]
MLPPARKTRFAAPNRRLVRPVVRPIIAYGLTYPAFARLAKEVYLDVAERDFALPFKRQTDSRIALVTGITRREIAQLRRQRGGAVDLPDVEESAVTHVIGRWMAGPPYATPDGMPRRLRYEASADAPSFSRLVRELGPDTPVRAVLDELLRTGSVTLTPEGDVELRREAHIPAGAGEGRFTLLGTDPGELFATIAHNIEQGDVPWLQRKVSYDNVGADALPALRDEARQLGLEFVRRANALLASYDRDRHGDVPGGARTRVTAAVYYFEEPVAPEADSDAPSNALRPPGRIRRKQR